ncbi:hypothetical protein Fot_11176 [Forsythia ovata]|uniref:Uncharacterized protein n=1 Tax=Forsythia ovata TaxID=205694 RepID=A0ABD1WIX8_9LAMI
MKDRDHYKEQDTWLQEALNESKRKMRPLIDEMDKLKKDLEAAESDVVEFSKRCDLANQAQKIMANALAKANTQMEVLIDRISQLEEANAQRKRLMDKIAQLEKTAECYDL